jgi:hypothetical protein
MTTVGRSGRTVGRSERTVRRSDGQTVGGIVAIEAKEPWAKVWLLRFAQDDTETQPRRSTLTVRPSGRPTV